MPEDKPEEYSLEGAVEALLFVSDEPISAATLGRFLDQSPSVVDTVLSTLATRLEEEGRGIQLREVAGGWRLYSHPAYHDIIENYVISWDTRSLSQAALEALAVIAYHQPATSAAINGIRGVNSDAVISSLVEKGLVREVGRDPGPGSAILYGTTRAFLEKFGLKSLKDLPPLEDFAPDEKSKEYIRARLSVGESATDIDYDEDDEPRSAVSAYEDVEDGDGEDAGDGEDSDAEDTYEVAVEDDDEDDDAGAEGNEGTEGARSAKSVAYEEVAFEDLEFID
jgi:segregation and condensation protein B